MKKLIVMTILVALMATPVMAGPTVIMNTGSPYTATVGVGPVGIYTAGQTFDTFCLEVGEYFVNGHDYDVTIGTAAINGGTTAQGGSPDPLDFDTAYLYTQYMNGNAAFQNAAAMQLAIHHIEQELVTTNTTALSYISAAALAGWTDLGNVRVMTLWNNATHDGYDTELKFRQDMLVQVPAPGAILLGSIGVSFVGWLKRRRSL